MKKLITISFLIFTGLSLQFCSSTKKVQQEAPKTTFEADVLPLVTTHCAPCHVPNGKREHLNNYAAAKEHIDEIITRIQKNPGEKGFMPFKRDKLSDSTIQVFVQWKNEGLLEK